MTYRKLAGILVIGLTLNVTAWASTDARVANAAMQEDLSLVRSLLAQKADVNEAQGDGMTALHWAAFKDDVDMSQLLLNAGANVKASTRLGALTPLFMACINGNPAMVDMLLKAGADANEVNTVNGLTVLMRAVVSGNAEAVKLLLDHGATVNVKEKAHGQTALMLAAANNRAAVIQVLAEHGAHLNDMTEVVKIVPEPRLDDNGNPIPARPARTNSKDGTGDDKSSGVPNVTVAATVTGGMTPLLFAARDGQLDAVRALLDAGADINLPSGSEKMSPLVIAIANGHYEVGKYLVDHGANPNLASIDGLAALYATIDMQYAPLSWEPNPIVSQEKVTYLELMLDLLDHGANPNQTLRKKLWFRPTSHDKAWINPQGSSPFWRAAQSSDIPAMKLLLARGADPMTSSDQKDSPLMVAAGVGWGPGNFSQNSPEPGAWLNTIKFCLDLGMDINQVDSQGYTALHGASFRGDDEMVEFLVKHGARMDIVSTKGYTAADMANGIDVVFGLPLVHPETVSLLVKLGSAPPTAPTVGTTKPKQK
jgi:ankyrin repeat protein